MKNFWNHIKLSTFTTNLKKPSSARIQSYAIMATIVLSSLFFLGIELVNAIIIWNKSEVYSPTAEGIIILGMFLAHHLALLGFKNNSEKNKMIYSPEQETTPEVKKDTPPQEELIVESEG